MPTIWRRRSIPWRERLDARPGESRAHAEMRADRRSRKARRRARRAAA